MDLSEAFVSMVISEFALWEGSELTKVFSRLSVWMSAPMHIPAEPGGGPCLVQKPLPSLAEHCAYTYKPSGDIR